VDDRDARVRQCQAGVERGDGGVAPAFDAAAVDGAQHAGVQHEVAGRDARDVDDRHHRADHGGELAQAGGGQAVHGQRRVGGAEVDLALRRQLDAQARADRVVAHGVAGGARVGLGPGVVDRRREGGAGAVQHGGSGRRVGCVGVQGQGEGQGRGQHEPAAIERKHGGSVTAMHGGRMTIDTPLSPCTGKLPVATGTVRCTPVKDPS